MTEEEIKEIITALMRAVELSKETPALAAYTAAELRQWQKLLANSQKSA